MQIVPRLISKFIPENYQLSIVINRTKRIFSGTVVIEGAVRPDVQTISLHSKKLSIETVLVDGKSAKYSHRENDELLIEHPDILPGEHLITIGFSGRITDSMHGMYPCYFEHDGVKKELLVTQFESHHAREVFPCIDEPEAKATFDLTISCEENVTVIGNMPIKEQVVENDVFVTTFETTPKMSSYLLAWVIGELHKKTSQTKTGVEINVWATPTQSSASLDFALDIAVRSTDFFSDFFDTPYPLPKCDHVALPDFSSGAMENWGLITYREVALLAEPNISSISSKRYIATVIAHEISHQWFGNLVTMKWWNDLWLNESFATLIEYFAVDKLEPSWEVWFDFMTYISISALRRDSLEGVQSVRTDVNHPDEISMLFDGAIVYAKGARLLQMLMYYIGEDEFKKGLKKYFKLHAYQNTESTDLWSALAETSHKDIEGFMNIWLDQPGYPVLHASRRGKTITLTQEKLASKSAHKDNSLWPIPLNSNCDDMPELLETKSAVVTTECIEPIMFNVNSYGHFVTHYDSTMLNAIVSKLKSDKLTNVDRLQILNEQRILASTGIVSHSELIPLLDAYRNETSEPVWDIISLTLGELKKFVENDEKSEEKLKTLAGTLATSEYTRLGWEASKDEPESDSRLRSTIIGLTLYSENKSAIEKAIKLFSDYELGNLDPELRPIIISTVVKYQESDKLIDNLINLYKNSSSCDIGIDICAGLTSTKKPQTVDKLLSIIKDSSFVRPQDIFRWIFYLMRNKYAREITWQWIIDNWQWIESIFASDKSFDDFPRAAAATLNTHQQLEQFIEFFEPRLNIPALKRTIKVGIHEITDRVNLIDADGEKARRALLDL